jgi:hypothetical protein
MKFLKTYKKTSYCSGCKINKKDCLRQLTAALKKNDELLGTVLANLEGAVIRTLSLPVKLILKLILNGQTSSRRVVLSQ